MSKGQKISGGEVNYFSLKMKSGEFCRIFVEQQGVDLEIEMIEPSGKRWGKINGVSGLNGSETTFFIASVNGEYKLEIRVLHGSPYQGSYSISTEERLARQQDRYDDLAWRILFSTSEADADRIMTSAPDLLKPDLPVAISNQARLLLGSNVPAEQVLHGFNQLLRNAGKFKGEQATTIAYNGIGNAYAKMSRYNDALKYLLKSLTHMEERVSYTLQGAQAFNHNLGNVLFDIGELYRKQRLYLKAADYFKRSVNSFTLGGDTVGIVSAQYSLGWCYVNLGNYQKAHEIFNESLIVAGKHSDGNLRMIVFVFASAAYCRQGRIARAIESLRSALKLADESRNAIAIGLSYELGRLYLRGGSMVEAYSSFVKAMRAAQANYDLEHYTSSILNIARIHLLRGDYREATRSYERGLKELDRLVDASTGSAKGHYVASRVNALNNIGFIKLREGDHSAALNIYTRNLEYLGTVKVEPDQNQVARSNTASEFQNQFVETNNLIGDLHAYRGSYNEAEKYFAKALSLAESAKDSSATVEALLKLADNASRQGNKIRASELITRAYSFVGNDEKRGRMNVLTKLAVAYRGMNRTKAADETFTEAIKIADSLRLDASSPDERANDFSNLLAPYDEYIDFLFDLLASEPTGGHDRRAFEISEKRRARSLLDSLREAKAEIRLGVDPGLIEQERQIQEKLNRAATAINPFSTSLLKGLANLEDAEFSEEPAVETDVVALNAELQQIRGAIRATSPRYAALTQPRSLTYPEAQALVDDETIVLNYTLGENRSYLWAISKGSVTTYELPSRPEIETSVKNVYKYLSDGAAADNPTSRNDFNAEAARLSKTVLGPVSSLLAKKRLVVVADGALQYVPFASLPDPRQAGYIPLFASNEVVFAPSLSVIGVLRSESARRVSASKSIAIFADPVFSEDDERLTMKPEEVHSNAETVTRALLLPKKFNTGIVGDSYRVPRLPYSKSEGEAIFAIAESGTASLAIDFDASRERAIGRQLSDFKIVHFATHGVLNSELPELSSLVLSLVNRKGEQVNGFLRLNEIYNMELNADLVVLSACETALGKEVRGEGLIGLTRGFMYAGAPRVIASLWKVDDVATAEFMKIFYQKMLKEKMRPAAALTATKLEMSRSKRWSAPYYWAAFELQGDWQ